MGGKGAPDKFFVKGKRLDGRKADEIREMEAKVGIIKRANGSGMFRMGNTIGIAAVYGPREMHPRHLRDPEKAVINYNYNMAPFSTTDRIKPGKNRRSMEINKVSKDAFSPVIFSKEFPNTGIDVHVKILRADGGTRCVGINSASLALADAGIPMKDLVPACAAGMVDDTVVLDIFSLEDNFGQVDLPITYIPREDKITLLQMDGIIGKDKYKKALKLAKKGCEQVYEVQRKALKERYKKLKNEVVF